MNIIHDIDQVHLHNTIVTLGKFDGNHLGHQLLFRTAVDLKTGDAKAVIFTFDVHPDRILKEQSTHSRRNYGNEESYDGHPSGLRTIQTNLEKENGDYPEGIDYLIEFPFNEKTRDMDPEQFVSDILVKRLGVKHIVAGTDFRFGKGRRGNVETLRDLGKVYGFSVHVMAKVMITLPGEETAREISSTLVKEEIQKGKMENVTAMLGRPFAVTGTILHGKHLGNTIGFPTINLAAPEDKILPPDGVYATWTKIAGKEHQSITNLGKRPTFEDGDQRTIETFLFDFHQEIYGQTATVAFCQYIRPEEKFDGIEELKKQINRDKEKVRDYFSRKEDAL